MPTIQNRKSVWDYQRQAAVAADDTAIINDLSFSGRMGAHELRLRLGISDPSAWASGSFFLIQHNGIDMLTIDDQLADLLMPVSIPVELTGKDSITIAFYNGNAASVEVAVVVRVDQA